MDHGGLALHTRVDLPSANNVPRPRADLSSVGEISLDPLAVSLGSQSTPEVA